MPDRPLKSFWITGSNPRGPIGFGVTALSLKDAIDIIEMAGYTVPRGKGRFSYRIIKSLQEVEYAQVRRNCGPFSVRGMWSPYGLDRLSSQSTGAAQE